MVGSPGTTRTRTNTSVSTAHSVGSASSSRLTMKRSMQAPPRPAGSAYFFLVVSSVICGPRWIASTSL